MLGRQGIITESEANTIIGGLRQVDKEIEDGQFVFDTADEDIHMAIERRMTEIIGPVGGKLHTGRSRNDQTTVDSKMHMRATIREIQQDIVNLQKIIIAKAENNINAIMPGYTHLQTGQPILLSHWIMAYYWM
ncbi:lyase family protein, partial [Macrococcoides caseolyticum]